MSTRSYGRRWALAALSIFGSGCGAILGLGDYSEDTCLDASKSPGEADIDCGGPCAACSEGRSCVSPEDCSSRVCNANGQCQAPSCDDGVWNGDELDADCGGSCSKKCGPGQACGADSDCVSGDCAAGSCASVCTDSAKGGEETDVDCGGSACPACADDLACVKPRDCLSGVCKEGACKSHHVFTERFGQATTDLFRVGLAVDAAGDVTITGAFKNTLNLGGADLVSAGSGYDIYLATYDSEGKHIASTKLGDSSYQNAYGVGVDPAGHRVLYGGFTGTLTFGKTPVMSSPDGTEDSFLVELDKSGSLLWEKVFDGKGTISDYSIAIDNQGNVSIAGDFNQYINLGGGFLTSAGVEDLCVARYNASGALVWSKRFGDEMPQFVDGVAADSKGNTILAGRFGGVLDFGGAPMSAVQVVDNGFLAKLSDAGDRIWDLPFQVAKLPGQIAFVKTDAFGDIFYAATIEGDGELDGAALTGAGGTDVLIVKLDSNGSLVWSKVLGDEKDQEIRSMDVDAAGNLILAGRFEGVIDFGGASLSSGSGSGLFVAKLGPDGDPIWSKSFGDPALLAGPYSGPVLASYGSERLFLAGLFNGSIDLGGGPIAADGQNIFLTRFLLP